MITSSNFSELREIFAREDARPSRHMVLFSGGQDSTTTLLMARQLAFDLNGHCTALSLRYGQRHVAELGCAIEIARLLTTAHIVLDVDALSQLGDSALFAPTRARPRSGASSEIGQKHEHDSKLPSTFVPGRNSLFLSLAAAAAYKLDMRYIWIGANQVDYSGYPDCRREYLEVKEQELRLALDRPELTIVAPLLDETKAGIFSIADQFGYLRFIIEQTHTCYRGERKVMHDWGFGCDACPACALRKRGYESFWGELKGVLSS